MASIPFNKSRLREIIATRSFGRGSFTLASGAQSSFYFDLKPTMLDPEGANLCARAFLAALAGKRCDCIGGLEMGAVPIIAAAAAMSFELGSPVRALFVRKAVKDHGTKKRVEGLHPSESLSGKTVVVAEDVTTSGGSALQAIEEFRAAGAIVSEAITLVDRQDGAQAMLAGHGITLTSVFTAADFL